MHRKTRGLILLKENFIRNVFLGRKIIIIPKQCFIDTGTRVSRVKTSDNSVHHDKNGHFEKLTKF